MPHIHTCKHMCTIPVRLLVLSTCQLLLSACAVREEPDRFRQDWCSTLRPFFLLHRRTVSDCLEPFVLGLFCSGLSGCPWRPFLLYLQVFTLTHPHQELNIHKSLSLLKNNTTIKNCPLKPCLPFSALSLSLLLSNFLN